MIRDILQNNLTPSDEFIFGTADLTGLIDEKFGAYRYGISIGKRLNNKIIDAILNGPTIEYYHYYNQINAELAEVAGIIKNALKRANIDSIVIEPTLVRGSKGYEKHVSALTADVSHKMVATRAGLGWIGKTGLFVSKEFGPRLRLVSLLTDHRPGHFCSSIDRSRCGICTVCVDKCPAQAANGILWNIKTHRDVFFNAHKCREKCVEFAKQRLNKDKEICGICMSVCPIGKSKNSAG